MPPLSSAADVRYELDRLRPNIHLEETEETWDKIAKALQELIKLCEDGAYDLAPTDLVTTVKSSHRPIVSAMNSERTRLCMVPMDLMSTLASVMGTDFEQLLPLFMPALIASCARTNKVIVNRAKGSILTIIQSAQLASVLTYFLQNIKDKSATLKVVIAEGTLACLNSCNPPDFEKEARATEVESIIRITARDANADVRKISRKIFESYKILLPSRVPSFITPLSPTTKKYLDIKAPTLASQKSVPNLRTADLTSKPESKASSSSNTLAAKSAHSRQPSSSTVSTRSTGAQIAQQQAAAASALTRVSRKEPPATSRTTAASSTASTGARAAPAPSAPVRPTQPSRVMTTDGTSRQRTVSTAQRSVTTSSVATGPSRTLRSQPSIISRSTTAPAVPSATSGGAQRIQKDAAASGFSFQPQQRQPPQGLSSNTTSTGPRRVPMPPPPPPAPKKEVNNDGPKRPSSRVDKEKETTNKPPSSTSNSSRQQPSAAVPPAPLKKKPTAPSLSSSVREKPAPTGPAATAGHSRSRSTVSASSGASAAAAKARLGASTAASAARSTGAGTSTTAGATKPLAVAKAAPAKPLWGARMAPAAKPVSAAGSKPSAASAAPHAASKGLVRKPSSRVVSESAAAPKAAATKGAVASTARVTVKRPVTPAQIALPPSPTPEEGEEEPQEQDAFEGGKHNEVKAEAAPIEIFSQRASPIFSAPSVDAAAEPDVQQGQEAVYERQGDDVAHGPEAEEDTQTEAEIVERTATPTAESEQPVAFVHVEGAVEGPSTGTIEESGVNEDENPQSTSSSRQPLSTIASNPQTPQQNLFALPGNANLITPALASKTPISALLSSIERGFQCDYSPITPLSPAANYLPNLTGEGTPYSHATHAPHRRFPLKDGVVQPFNHALHVPGHNGMFGGYNGSVAAGGKGYDVVETNVSEKTELSVVPVPVQFGTENLYSMPVALPGLDDGRLSIFDLSSTSKS